MSRKYRLRRDSWAFGRVDAVLRDYNSGLSLNEMGRLYGVDSTNILRVLRTLGAKMRSPSEGIKLCVDRGKWPRGAGPDNPSWKGGTNTHSSGYKMVMRPTHHRSDCRGYVQESILVLEAKLGRPLLDREVPHHVNRDKKDNRPENLEVMTKSQHGRLHGREGALKRWRGRRVFASAGGDE